MDRLRRLFTAYKTGTLTDVEKGEFMAMLLDETNEQAMQQLLDEQWLSLQPADMPADRANEIFHVILPPRRIGWQRWAVAATIAMLIGLAVFFIARNHGTSTTDSDPVVAHNTDIAAPVANAATITTADGQVVDLKHITNQSFSSNNDGIIYNEEAPGYHTLTNPRGSLVINTTLIDGSKVWLNAGSSIRYFANRSMDREVTITGEAYFEVAKNGKPFTVIYNDDRVEVLGTHFNINAYDRFTVTLLEGSVKVNDRMLEPGQQFTNGEVKAVDTGEIMAWKEGVFDFRRKTLDAIMKELAPWYDIDVQYVRPPGNKTFSATLSRYSKLSDVLKIMEGAGIRFAIENKTVRVTP